VKSIDRNQIPSGLEKAGGVLFDQLTLDCSSGGGLVFGKDPGSWSSNTRMLVIAAVDRQASRKRPHALATIWRVL